MSNNLFTYHLSEYIAFFTDSLRKNAPCVYLLPRDHESLFFVTKGTLLYENGDHKQIIKEGQVGYIARGAIDKSSAYNCDEVSYIAVNFNFSETAKSKTLPFETLCSYKNSYQYEKLFKQALNFFLFKTPGYNTIIKGILLQIIGLLYSEHETSNTDFSSTEKLEKSIEHLKKHYNNPELQINHLAQIANLSTKHYRRLFFDLYRKTPYAFLQEFRISKGEILLLNTSKSILEIALQCGFSDVYSFSRSFKKHTGISPSEYKKVFKTH